MYQILIENDNLLAITSNEKTDFSPSNSKYLDNLEELSKELGIKVENIFRPSQTHSDNLVEITQDTKLPIPDCDAFFTNIPDKYLGVLTADCLPILFHDETTNIVGAVHAGWVGSVKHITYKTLKYLIDNKGLNPQTTNVLLCPSIAQSNYQVDDMVKDKVKETTLFDIEDLFINQDSGKYLFDNRLYNIKQLLSLGILKENITIDDKDTFSNNSYFSYREDKTSGRNLSLIGLKPSKKNYRKYFKSITPRNIDKQNQSILEQLNTLIKKNNYQNIMAFIPMPNEPNITSLLEDDNINIYVPRIIDETTMIPVKYDKDKLRMNSLKCMDCLSDETINPNDLDLIIIPAAAYDKEKNRLGHGKGFYDRFLPKTKAKKVGITYNEYIVDNLPTNQFDIKMDEVITGK